MKRSENDVSGMRLSALIRRLYRIAAPAVWVTFKRFVAKTRNRSESCSGNISQSFRAGGEQHDNEAFLRPPHSGRQMGKQKVAAQFMWETTAFPTHREIVVPISLAVAILRLTEILAQTHSGEESDIVI